MSQATQIKKPFQSLAALKDVHVGQIGFVIGNGWSVTYYDTSKMKADGILIGCNKAFKKFPIDYLVWQDNSVDKDCMEFRGPKITTNRKGRVELDSETTYYYGFTKRDGMKNKDGNIRLMHSGGVALQIACQMGCNPVILVGCDCRVFPVNGQDAKYQGHRTNVFDDRQVHRFFKEKDRSPVNGKLSTNHLRTFMRKFEMVYEQFKNDVDIYMLGPWSISTTIPWVEWEGYWSPDHPERAKNGGEKR